MKTPLTFASILLFGSMGISGCSSDNNEINVEVMQNNPENFMPELSPEQQAEVDQTKEMLRNNRGWINVKPLTKEELRRREEAQRGEQSAPETD